MSEKWPTTANSHQREMRRTLALLQLCRRQGKKGKERVVNGSYSTQRGNQAEAMQRSAHCKNSI